jgi:WD40 repeat protein
MGPSEVQRYWYGLQHGDLHPGNILIEGQKRPDSDLFSQDTTDYWLIDFPFASHKPLFFDHAYFEVGLLLRRLKATPHPHDLLRLLNLTHKYDQKSMEDRSHHTENLSDQERDIVFDLLAWRKAIYKWRHVHQPHHSIPKMLRPQMLLARVAAGLNYARKSLLDDVLRPLAIAYAAWAAHEYTKDVLQGNLYSDPLVGGSSLQPGPVSAWTPSQVGLPVAPAQIAHTRKAATTRSVNLVAQLRGQGDKLLAIAWSPDGCNLASASRNGTFRIWEWQNGQFIETTYGEPVSCVAWSPEGDRVAIGVGSAIKLRTNSSADAGSLPAGHARRVAGLAWSSTHLASAAEDHTIRLWSVADPEESRVLLAGHSKAVLDVSWAPISEVLASVGLDGRCLLWEPPSTVVKERSKDLKDAAGCVRWAPDGSVIAIAVHSGRIIVLDSQSLVSRKNWQGHRGRAICSLSFSADGRLLASKGGDDLVRLWRTSDWKQVGQFSEPWSWTWPIAIGFHPTNPALLATLGDNDTAVRVWQLNVDDLVSASS